jgi:hypothetical protein
MNNRHVNNNHPRNLQSDKTLKEQNYKSLIAELYKKRLTTIKHEYVSPKLCKDNQLLHLGARIYA